MNAITVKAHAKVNLLLKVMGRRSNGYHDLVMIMERLALADDIILEPISRGIELTMDGVADDGMTAEKNLAWRAAHALKEATGEIRGVRIHLTKHIPVAAGLGGGSSDAAATLKGLNRLWQKGMSNEQLAHLGAGLGADVPFFCYEGPALVSGVGDCVSPIEKLPKLFILLINPGFAVSTPWVYRQWDCLNGIEDSTRGAHQVDSGTANDELKFMSTRQGFSVGNHGLRWLTVGNAGDRVPRLFDTLSDVSARLDNDLEQVTIPAHPEIGTIKDYLSHAGARGVLMSGSGPTVFGLFDSAVLRDEAAAGAPKEAWTVIATENWL